MPPWENGNVWWQTVWIASIGSYRDMGWVVRVSTTIRMTRVARFVDERFAFRVTNRACVVAVPAVPIVELVVLSDHRERPIEAVVRRQ